MVFARLGLRTLVRRSLQLARIAYIQWTFLLTHLISSDPSLSLRSLDQPLSWPKGGSFPPRLGNSLTVYACHDYSSIVYKIDWLTFRISHRPSRATPLLSSWRAHLMLLSVVSPGPFARSLMFRWAVPICMIISDLADIRGLPFMIAGCPKRKSQDLQLSRGSGTSWGYQGVQVRFDRVLHGPNMMLPDY